jgi:hypothetical protein
MREVGQMAVRLLIEMIGDPHAEPREVLLKPALVRRESTGNAPEGERRQSGSIINLSATKTH